MRFDLRPLRRLWSILAGRHDPANRRPDDFILVRIIGNDLPPRHARGQSRANLRFILDHEPALEACAKRWIVNRIVDEDERAAVEALLRERGQTFLTVPFDLDAYAATAWEIEGVPPALRPGTPGFDALDPARRGRLLQHLYRRKNLYVMNNNGARNLALAQWRHEAKWVLPWDGNCFVTAEAWAEFRAAIARRPRVRYAIVPMARIADNAHLLDPTFRPPAAEEPQIAFRCDAAAEFDAAIPYGRRPKVALLHRLGVPGPWDRWRLDPWDRPYGPPAPDFCRWTRAGWVARLAAGAQAEDADRAIVARGVVRAEGVMRRLARLDSQVLRRHYDPARTLTFDIERLRAQDGPEWRTHREALDAAAAAALARGPFSVRDKTRIAPSGDPQDYHSIAPYFWPNPDTPDGRPRVRRDGQRAPGTTLYEPGSEQWDRTALQRVFDDTTVLALAHLRGAPDAAAAHAALLVRRWFLDPATRMNPHLDYAQVRTRRGRDEGQSVGIIEARDVYYFLDAVRVLTQSGALDARETDAFRQWLTGYARWLDTGDLGRRERGAANNHGTAYDLQRLAIAAYLGEEEEILATLRRARFRILGQFAPDGAQPEELSRTLTAHYCAFNLQLFVCLGELAEGCGDGFAHYAAEGRSLQGALDWFFGQWAAGWSFQQIEPFDADRIWPLVHAYRRWYGAPRVGLEPPPPQAVTPTFHQTAGLRPLWALGRDFGGI